MLLTVCIPTFNRASDLEICLESVELASKKIQTPIEVLVSNNNSTDNTDQILGKWRFSNPNIVFKHVKQPNNLGPLLNIDYIAQAASGKFLFWCTDDDTLTPNVIEEALRLSSKGEHDFVRFALVVHDSPRNSLYVHAINPSRLDNQTDEKKFIEIFMLTHILTGTLVSSAICKSIPDHLKSNIYPMALWCSSAYGRTEYSSFPAAIHTYGNEVFWGNDVETESVGVQGSQSADNLIASLNLIRNASFKLELHKHIYSKFNNKTYKKSLRLLNFKLEINKTQILSHFFSQIIRKLTYKLKEKRSLFNFI